MDLCPDHAVVPSMVAVGPLTFRRSGVGLQITIYHFQSMRQDAAKAVQNVHAVRFAKRSLRVRG